MSTYMAAQIKINDLNLYKKYEKAFIETLAPYKGELVIFSNDIEVLEGYWPYPRIVVLRFPDEQLARKWHSSQEYQSIAKVRKSSSESNIILIKNSMP